MSDLNLWLPELREANRTIRKREEEITHLRGLLGEIKVEVSRREEYSDEVRFDSLNLILSRINEGSE
jgi:hypothetical protein